MAGSADIALAYRGRICDRSPNRQVLTECRSSILPTKRPLNALSTRIQSSLAGLRAANFAGIESHFCVPLTHLYPSISSTSLDTEQGAVELICNNFRVCRRGRCAVRLRS
jgi:hypothetical protein